MTASHGDWKILNGATYSGSCGSFSIDATDAVLVQSPGRSVGSKATADSLMLTQAQLPKVSLSGSTDSYRHNHSSGNGDTSPGDYGLIRRPEYGDYKTYAYAADAVGSDVEPDIVSTPQAIKADVHSHAVSVPLNSAAVQSGLALGVANLPRVVVNYFMCVN